MSGWHRCLIGFLLFLAVGPQIFRFFSEADTFDEDDLYRETYIECSGDYPALYREQLAAVFGPEMTFTEKERIKNDPELAGFYGVYKDGWATTGESWEFYTYDRWKIVYRDSLGRQCVRFLDNKRDFAIGTLQTEWMMLQLQDYYEECYLDRYMPARIRAIYEWECGVYLWEAGYLAEYTAGGAEADGTYCALAADLESGDTILQLDRLDYSQVCAADPLHVSVCLKINEDMGQAEWETCKREAEDGLRAVGEAMSRDVEGLNLQIELRSFDHSKDDSYHQDEERKYWNWIGGVETESDTEQMRFAELVGAYYGCEIRE